MRLLKIAIPFFILFATFQVTGYFVSRNFLFLPAKSRRLPSVPNGRVIQIKNGSRYVYGYFSRRGRKLIAFFHGQGGTMRSDSRAAGHMVARGFSVLLVEYPGYGLAGSYSVGETNIYSDSTALIRYVQKRYGFSTDDTALWGYSLGTGVAAEMAHQRLGNRLVLLAPYTSIPDVADELYMPVVPHLIIWDRFNTASKAPEIDCPTIILHGRRDRAVPFYMGEDLHRLFPRSEFVPLGRTGHNIFSGMGRQDWNRIALFLR